MLPLEKKTIRFLHTTERLLFFTLLLMILGFFTWSENITITRIIKVSTRLGMTGSIFFIHQSIVNFGAVGSFRYKNSLSILFYLMYLLLGLISFLWSTDVAYSSLQWVMDVESLVFSFFFIQSLLLVEKYFPSGDIKFHQLIGNSAFIIIAIFIIGSYINPDDYYRLVEGGTDKRLGGYIMNPNELGMLCGVGIATLLFDLYDRKKKIWTLFKIFLIGYALLLTKSRSSLLGLLLIIFFHIRNAKNKKLEAIVYILIALAIPFAIENLIVRKGGIEDVLSMTGRLPFWIALITEGLPREPLLGFGFMRIDYKDYFESIHTYRAHMTHNTFIQVLMNLGFVGFTIVLFQMVFTIRAFLNEPGRKKLLLVGILIPVLINSFTEFGIFGENNYGIFFYQLLIMAIGLENSDIISPAQKWYLKKKRPDLAIHTT
jgi:exopolysaccharide production protein ExoQ